MRTPIKRFTETGIETTDGAHREVDAVFCATGANVDMVPAFPSVPAARIYERYGRRMASTSTAYNYLGLSVPGFPNLGIVQGPYRCRPVWHGAT